MKRGKKNNAFTEALGAELSTRKVLEKAKDNAENRILIADMESDFESDFAPRWNVEPTESSTPISQSKISAEPKPKKKTKTANKVSSQKKVSNKKVSEKNSAPEKISTDKKISVPEKISVPKKIEPESEFEKRIFAEAENDFYDEKIPQNIGDNLRSKILEKDSDSLPEEKSSSSFRSRFFNKPLEDLEEKNSDSEEENPPDFDPELHRKLSRAELAGVGLSAIMMIYAFVNLDKPLFFLALSLFTHLLRPLVGAFCGKYNRAVQNAMRSFSIVVFVGAIVILFMMR